MTTPETPHSSFLYTRTIEMRLTLRSIAAIPPADAEDILRDVMAKRLDIPRDLLVALTRRACARPAPKVGKVEKVRPA